MRSTIRTGQAAGTLVLDSEITTCIFTCLDGVIESLLVTPMICNAISVYDPHFDNSLVEFTYDIDSQIGRAYITVDRYDFAATLNGTPWVSLVD